MGYKTATDYSINKNTDDIVYRYANGEADRYIKELDADGAPTGRILLSHKDESGSETVRVLLKSEMTVEQFDAMKAFSDASYHEIDKGDVYQWKNSVSLSDLEGCHTLDCNDSAEDEFFKRLEDEPEDARTMENAMSIMDACLTPTQKRRYYAYYYEGKSMDEIAAEEGVFRNAVNKSIHDSEKKIEKFLGSPEKRVSKTPEKR